MGAHFSGGVNKNSNARATYSISIVRTQTEAEAIAIRKNGDQREMKVILKPVNINFDILVGISKRIELGLAIGAQHQNGRLYSGYRYNTGVLSYGTDQNLNGIFRFNSNMTLNLGARIDIKIIRPLRFSIRGEYIGLFASTFGSKYNPHRDELYAQSNSGGIFDNGDAHYYLPEDANNGNNRTVYNDGLGINFFSTFTGWRITTGLVFDILTWRTDK